MGDRHLQSGYDSAQSFHLIYSPILRFLNWTSGLSILRCRSELGHVRAQRRPDADRMLSGARLNASPVMSLGIRPNTPSCLDQLELLAGCRVGDTAPLPVSSQKTFRISGAHLYPDSAVMLKPGANDGQADGVQLCKVRPVRNY